MKQKLMHSFIICRLHGYTIIFNFLCTLIFKCADYTRIHERDVSVHAAACESMMT